MSQIIQYPRLQAAIPDVLFTGTSIMYNIKFNKQMDNPENPTHVGENTAFSKGK